MKDYVNCKDCQCSNCEYKSNADICGACDDCENGKNQLWDYSCGTHVPQTQINSDLERQNENSNTKTNRRYYAQKAVFKKIFV